MSQVIIRSALKGDINGILEVQNELLLSDKRENAEKKGFLIYPVKSEELEDVIISGLNIIIVAVCENKIVGYGLTYDLKEWMKVKKEMHIEADGLVKKHLLKDKILYFRHIVRKENFHGVGERIEAEVYQQARREGYRFVVGEILEKPISNERSRDVHIRRGFGKIGQVSYGDEKLWGLYEKKL